MAYVYQLGMLYSPLAYITCFAVWLGFTTNLCARLAILTHRISILKDNHSDPRIVFQQHTQQHIKIVV